MTENERTIHILKREVFEWKVKYWTATVAAIALGVMLAFSVSGCTT